MSERALAPFAVHSTAAMRRRAVLLSLLVCTLSALSPKSWSALGGSFDTVPIDEAQLRATRRISSNTGYDVHELLLTSGTVVREFVAPTGLVFAVTWQGPIKPDLNKLLCAHFQRLVAAGRSPHGDHHTLSVQAADLVIESGGRMRGFAGRAYLPALVPASVGVGEIR